MTDPETIAAMLPKLITFQNDEIAGYRSRVGGEANAAQRSKLQSMREIRDMLEYLKSAIERRRTAA